MQGTVKYWKVTKIRKIKEVGKQILIGYWEYILISLKQEDNLAIIIKMLNIHIF